MKSHFSFLANTISKDIFRNAWKNPKVEIYLSKCWLDLSSNSRVIVDFLLFWNKKNWRLLSRWNSSQLSALADKCHFYLVKSNVHKDSGATSSSPWLHCVVNWVVIDLQHTWYLGLNDDVKKKEIRIKSISLTQPLMQQ